MNRILLVDGDTGTRGLLATYLCRRGYTVDEAPTPTSALHAVTVTRPALVVTELFAGMPGFLEALRESHPAPPVLVWSARTDRETRLLVDGLGCEFLAKPASPQDVAFRIARLLAGDPVADLPRMTRPHRRMGGGEPRVLGTNPAAPGA